jgi:integrase
MKKKNTTQTLTIKGQTMKLYRSEQEKGGRTYVTHTLAYIANGRRQRKGFASEQDARDAAKTIADQLASGTGHAGAYTPSELADLRAAERILRQHPRQVSLAAAVDSFVRAAEALGDDDIVAACRAHKEYLAKQNTLKRGKAPDVVAAFLASMEADGASPRYLQDLKHRLERFKKRFHGYLDTITSDELKEWLDGLGVKRRTRANFRGALVSLFSYAKQNKYLPSERQTEAQLLASGKRFKSAKAKEPIGIYSPAEMAKILNAAPEHLRPIFALGAFAGLRSSEIFGLKWGDINKKQVVVEAGNSKTASRRLVPVQPALSAWLATYERGKADEGLCSRWSHESTFTATMSEAVRRAGVEPVANGLRHSFISYRVAKVKRVDSVALEAGNSPTMIFRHYREVKTREGKLVTPALAAAWFKILPSRGSNVVPFAKAS